MILNTPLPISLFSLLPSIDRSLSNGFTMTIFLGGKMSSGDPLLYPNSLPSSRPQICSYVGRIWDSFLHASPQSCKSLVSGRTLEHLSLPSWGPFPPNRNDPSAPTTLAPFPPNLPSTRNHSLSSCFCSTAHDSLQHLSRCSPSHLLGLLGLRIQRMSTEPGKEFNNPCNYPYLTVASPSCHDVTPLRAW